MEHLDYSGAIRWQFEHDVSVEVTAQLFGKKRSSIAVIAWRATSRLLPRKVEDVLSVIQTTGHAADTLLGSARVEDDDLNLPPKPGALEEQVDAFGRTFWQKVRDHRGAKDLGLLLRQVSRPSQENIPLQRVAARLYHLLAEVYLHAGCCQSSLIFSMKAYRAAESLYKDTLNKHELFSIGKTSLLISQALINRSDFSLALPWIERSKRAFEAGSHQADPEHYKQLATVQFHTGATEKARSNYVRAGQLLQSYRHKPNATTAEVRDISERPLNLVSQPIAWEEAFDLAEYALRNWPTYDIHKALNVNWAAAAGLMSGSTEGARRAIELLQSKKDLSRGYLHPQTVTELLLMTPALPKALRAEWAKFCLHYNAFRNK